MTQPTDERDDRDIRYALADDLDRMGLWPNEDREVALQDYDEFYDGDIDTP